MSIPGTNRSEGCEIRLTEIPAMGSSAGSPHPMSQKAPKVSSRVIRAGTMSPHRMFCMYSYRHRSWASRRDSTARRRPSGRCSKPETVKQTGLLTREIRAMSRVVPSAMPTAPS